MAGIIATLTLQLQPMMETTVTLGPNDKYDAVVRGEPVTDETYETEEEYRENHPAPDAADTYAETISEAPTAEDLDEDPEELPTLSWDMISVSDDADLVAKMATYFEGMCPDEPTDQLQAKLRLLDVCVYANAQIAAKGELRDE